MSKLTLLALAFTALVALATAHTTIITTTIEDDNRPSSQCRQKLQMQRLDQCQRYLQQQGQSPYELNRRQSQHGQDQEQQLQQQCCQQLQKVDRQCQCEAVKQVFETARRQMQGRQQGQFGSQRQLEQQLEQKAQNLPQQCGLQIRQEECQIRSGDSQEFNRIQGQRFNQCQRFIQQAQQESGSPRVMMVSRHSQQQSQQLQQQLRQCCNELENVQKDRQCEALEEVYRQAVQQQQGGQQQQPRQHGGQQQDQPWQRQPQRQQGSQQIGRAIEIIHNQCDLQVEQCRISSEMF